MHKINRVFPITRGRRFRIQRTKVEALFVQTAEVLLAYHDESVIRIFIPDIHSIMMFGLFHRMIQNLGVLDARLVEGWWYGRRRVWNEVTQQPFGCRVVYRCKSGRDGRYAVEKKSDGVLCAHSS